MPDWSKAIVTLDTSEETKAKIEERKRFANASEEERRKMADAVQREYDKKLMKKRFLYLILPVLTVILEALPFGAVLNFANPEGEPFRQTFSYFSLTPFGYANFAPLITAVTTCVALVLIAVYAVTGKHNVSVTAGIMLAIGTVISLMPLLYGIRSYSVIGLFITILLAAETVLLFTTVKKEVYLYRK